MNYNYHEKLKPRSRELRKNMTKEERKLWYEFLRELPVTIHRQKMIGDYILDFYCAARRVAIELDGSQHYVDDNAEYDRKRDAYLNSMGITVLRYSNRDIKINFDGVCSDILSKLGLV